MKNEMKELIRWNNGVLQVLTTDYERKGSKGKFIYHQKWVDVPIFKPDTGFRRIVKETKEQEAKRIEVRLETQNL